MQQPIFRVVKTTPDTRGVVGEETAFEYQGRIMQMPGSTIEDDLEDARMALIAAMDGIRRKCEGGADAAGTLGPICSGHDWCGSHLSSNGRR